MQILQFLVNYLGSVIDKDLRKVLIRDLFETNINGKKLDEILKIISQRLKSNIY